MLFGQDGDNGTYADLDLLWEIHSIYENTVLLSFDF